MSGAALFSATDLQALRARGLPQQEAGFQLTLLQNPPPPRRLERACVVGDPILVLPPARVEALAAQGRAVAQAGRVGRFIPASGAASRMFQALAGPAARIGLTRAQLEKARETQALEFLDQLPRFAFYEDLKAKLGAQGAGLEALLSAGTGLEAVFWTLLSPQGLNYAALPKALLLFHRTALGPRSALQEQVAEALDCVAGRGRCRLHFTVSPEHLELFRAQVAACPSGEVALEAGFSTQDPSTDTLALDLEGGPFRQDGALLFRPGGHGALLKNLNALDGDLVQIKNIDNIAHESRRAVNVLWKNALTGLLVELQQGAHRALADLRGGSPEPARAFLKEKFFLEVGGAGAADLERLLDSPLRVCGMVRNQGEPGGGPYWVRDRAGVVRPQIVETAEVDLRDPAQRAVVDQATHFNPVDLVVALRDSEGRAYDLERFCDERAVFIAEKSHQGRGLLALERPGLWNGSMAGWLTALVEVPLDTFNPVKTINDLLRPGHQGGI